MKISMSRLRAIIRETIMGLKSEDAVMPGKYAGNAPGFHRAVDDERMANRGDTSIFISGATDGLLDDEGEADDEDQDQ